MERIETPEELAKKLSDCQHTAPYIASLITARDAAIRSKQAELLRVCGEALKALVSSIGGAAEMCQCTVCIAVRQAKSALAALEDAGRVKEMQKNEQEKNDA